MKIQVEIPVNTDGPLTAAEREKFKEYLWVAAENALRPILDEKFGAGTRMHGVTCRFSFSKPRVTVE